MKPGNSVLNWRRWGHCILDKQTKAILCLVCSLLWIQCLELDRNLRNICRMLDECMNELTFLPYFSLRAVFACFRLQFSVLSGTKSCDYNKTYTWLAFSQLAVCNINSTFISLLTNDKYINHHSSRQCPTLYCWGRELKKSDPLTLRPHSPCPWVTQEFDSYSKATVAWM